MIPSSLVDGAPRGATCPFFSQRVLQRNPLWSSNHLFGLAVFSWERAALSPSKMSFGIRKLLLTS